jgi:hypothetical protein
MHDGLCERRELRCVANSSSCNDSIACREEGHCSAVDERCLPASDADCARSLECIDDGRCRFRLSTDSEGGTHRACVASR